MIPTASNHKRIKNMPSTRNHMQRVSTSFKKLEDAGTTNAAVTVTSMAAAETTTCTTSSSSSQPFAVTNSATMSRSATMVKGLPVTYRCPNLPSLFATALAVTPITAVPLMPQQQQQQQQQQHTPALKRARSTSSEDALSSSSSYDHDRDHHDNLKQKQDNTKEVPRSVLVPPQPHPLMVPPPAYISSSNGFPDHLLLPTLHDDDDDDDDDDDILNGPMVGGGDHDITTSNSSGFLRIRSGTSTTGNEPQEGLAAAARVDHDGNVSEDDENENENENDVLDEEVAALTTTTSSSVGSTVTHGTKQFHCLSFRPSRNRPDLTQVSSLLY